MKEATPSAKRPDLMFFMSGRFHEGSLIRWQMEISPTLLTKVVSAAMKKGMSRMGSNANPR